MHKTSLADFVIERALQYQNHRATAALSDIGPVSTLHRDRGDDPLKGGRRCFVEVPYTVLESMVHNITMSWTQMAYHFLKHRIPGAVIFDTFEHPRAKRIDIEFAVSPRIVDIAGMVAVLTYSTGRVVRDDWTRKGFDHQLDLNARIAHYHDTLNAEEHVTVKLDLRFVFKKCDETITISCWLAGGQPVPNVYDILAGQHIL